MALPFFYPFKTRMLNVATSSTGGAEIKAVIPARCKYVSTILSIGGTTAGGTSGFDIFSYSGGLGGGTSSPTIAVISSGLSITTTTGNVSFNFVAPATIYFNQGDIIGVSGSTGIAGVSGFSATHVLQEF